MSAVHGMTGAAVALMEDVEEFIEKYAGHSVTIGMGGPEGGDTSITATARDVCVIVYRGQQMEVPASRELLMDFALLIQKWGHWSGDAEIVRAKIDMPMDSICTVECTAFALQPQQEN